MKFFAWKDVALGPPRTLTWAPGYDAVIYALVDPRDWTVRYVGKTVKALRTRLAEHIERPVSQDMSLWLAELGYLRLLPDIKVITLATLSTWERAEVDWIRWFASRAKLYNRDPGGVAREGAKTTLRGRIRATILQRESALTPKQREKLTKQRKQYVAALREGEVKVLSKAEIAKLNLTPPKKPRGAK